MNNTTPNLILNTELETSIKNKQEKFKKEKYYTEIRSPIINLTYTRNEYFDSEYDFLIDDIKHNLFDEYKNLYPRALTD